MCVWPIPNDIIEIAAKIFRNIGRLANDLFISRFFFFSPRDKLHHLGLMFDSIKPKPLGDIPCDHFMVPSIFQFSDGYIYFPNLILSLRFNKCMCNTLFLYFFLKFCMKSFKAARHIRLKFNWHAKIST